LHIWPEIVVNVVMLDVMHVLTT